MMGVLGWSAFFEDAARFLFPTSNVMKNILFILPGAILALGFFGCVVAEDDMDPNDAVIGASTGAAHVTDRDFDLDDDRIDGDSDDFDSLEDYDDVLTDQERRVLRERAEDAGDDEDEYLEYLTEVEKANLRDRAYDLIE